MKKGETTLIAFADFSKAFDAVGFSHGAPNWILNYLSGRKQFVQINDKQSKILDKTTTNNPTTKLPLQYIWDFEATENFRKTLKSDEIQEKLNQFLD